MADKVELDIVFLDQGSNQTTPSAGGAASSGQAPRTGTPQGAPQQINPATVAIAAAGRSPSGAGQGAAAAGAGSSVASASAIAAVAIAAFVLVLNKLNEVMSTVANQIGLRSRAMTRAIGDNDTVGKTIDERRATDELLKEIPLIGKTIVAVREFESQRLESFKRETDAMQRRAQTLGQYSGPLAVEQSRSINARIGRELAEADVLGPQYAALERSKRGFDESSQVLSALISARQVDTQRQAYEQQMADNNRQIAELVKKLGTVGEVLARELKKQTKGPLDKLLEGIRVPSDTARDDDVIGRFRDQRMNTPVLGPG